MSEQASNLSSLDALDPAIREAAPGYTPSHGYRRLLLDLHPKGSPSTVRRMRTFSRVLPDALSQTDGVMDAQLDWLETTADPEIVVGAVRLRRARQAAGLAGWIAVENLITPGVLASLPDELREEQRRRYLELNYRQPDRVLMVDDSKVKDLGSPDGFERTPDSVVIWEGEFGVAALAEYIPVARDPESGVITGFLIEGALTDYYEPDSRGALALADWHSTLSAQAAAL